MSTKPRVNQSGSVAELGEFALIELLTRNAKLSPGVVGAGDDCAVVPGSLLGAAGGRLLFTADLMVENRHFRRSYMSPADIGWKLLAVNASDVAAMGGSARAALVTLQLPPDLDVSFVEGLYAGMYELAEEWGIEIVGGDTSAGEEVSLGIALIGFAAEAPILRSGARPGDVVYLSGPCGLSNLGLRDLEGEKLDLPQDILANARRQFLRPRPRLDLSGILLASGAVGAMIDISDGLVQDAGHVAKQSNAAIVIDVAAASALGGDKYLEAALSGGEDYELLFTVRPERAERLEREFEKVALRPRRVGEVETWAGGDAPQVYLSAAAGRKLPWTEYFRAAGWPERCGYKHF